MKQKKQRVLVAMTIVAIVAIIHAFRLGQLLEGRAYELYYGYFSDIVLPFAAYFLLCINEISLPFLKSWLVKALIVFGAAAGAEVLQFFGIPFLGVTFDPLGFLMYGAGVFLAVLFEQAVIVRLFPGWQNE